MVKSLENKIYMILNVVQLGMDKYRAYLLFELTNREIAYLDKNKKFQAQIVATEVNFEQNLLDKYAEIIEQSVVKGNPSAIQWMLSKINPARWGVKADFSDKFLEEKVRIYLPDNGRAS